MNLSKRTPHYDRDFILQTFAYDPASENEILRRAKELIGLTIAEVILRSPVPSRTIDPNNKGAIGNIIEECWFGIKNNPSPDPDFVNVGIELKIIPLEKISSGLSVKERTKVCSIDYFKLITESWKTSHARRKLDKILFIYYHYDSADQGRSKIAHYDLWRLIDQDENIISADWKNVLKVVQDGKAHTLSERLSRVLAASRTGSGGVDAEGNPRDLVKQPRSTTLALRRAFSLKPSFTNQRWLQLHKGVRFESIVRAPEAGLDVNFEKVLLKKLHRYEGIKLGDFANKFNIVLPKGKNAAATIIKKALGFKSVKSHIKEFEQAGIVVKIVPIRPSDGMPWEAVSFPAFKMKELVKEAWEQASIQEHISRILFVPICRDVRTGVPLKDRVIGRAFFWSPSEHEWTIIKKEWTQYQEEIAAGKAKVIRTKKGKSFLEVTGLTKESGTQIIHVRPHGVDMKDRDVDSKGNSVVKQSFCLNKSFVQGLIKRPSFSQMLKRTENENEEN